MQTHTVANYQLEQAEHGVQEALAREAALRRERDELLRELSALRDAAVTRIAGLTVGQREIMELVFAGQPKQEHRLGPRRQPTDR